MILKTLAQNLKTNMRQTSANERNEKTTEKRMRPHCDGVMAHINHHVGVDPSVLKKIAVNTPKPKEKEKEPTTTIMPNALPTPSPPQGEVEHEMMTKMICSNGKEFAIEFPATHRLVHKDHLTRWHNDSQKLQCARAKLQSVQHAACSIFSPTLWSIAVTSAPTLALSAAQCLFPLLLCVFFHDTCLLNGLSIDKFAKAFPSDNTLQKCNFSQAACDNMVLGNNLSNMKMRVSCDKGNKRGVGHVVKVLLDLSNDGFVQTRLLDVDAAGGTSKDAAAAIQASMNKLKSNDDDDTHLLHDQATDSGDGGTVESLHNEMKELGLAATEIDHLIAVCCIPSAAVKCRQSHVWRRCT